MITNHATAQTITPAIPKRRPVVMPVLEMSAQTAGMPIGSRSTWSTHEVRAFAVAMTYPPAKPSGIKSVATINGILFRIEPS